jgi:hypothetical protein
MDAAHEAGGPLTVREERAALFWVALWPLACAALVRPLSNVP